MRTYCASTLPFSPFPLTEFVGELSEGGVSAIELAQTHFSDVEAETIDAPSRRDPTQFQIYAEHGTS